jgi:hypothetical protein
VKPTRQRAAQQGFTRRPHEAAVAGEPSDGLSKDILTPHLEGGRTVAVGLGEFGGDGHEGYDSANADC